MWKRIVMNSTICCILCASVLAEPFGDKTMLNLHDSAQIQQRRPILIAHRGGVVTFEVPECSMAAVDQAAAVGYDMVELDVRESKDHEPIVFHDSSLLEDCGVDAAIGDLTSIEISEIRYTANNEPISTLAEAIRLCRKRELGVMLDIKAGDSDAFFKRICEIIDQYVMSDSTCCINGAPAIRAGLEGRAMLRVPDDVYAAMREGKAADLTGLFWFGLPQNLPTDMVAKLRAAGALVIPGVNIFRYDAATHRADALADIERLKVAGVDGFQIDSAYQDYFGMPLP
ncbi:MAG: hypothetical protein KJ052_05580 [Candidatus Hydrogenedentes bacterium]|nr:hypothetical protein [Candidatus Hydrogenedentota bacterium]